MNGNVAEPASVGNSCAERSCSACVSRGLGVVAHHEWVRAVAGVAVDIGLRGRSTATTDRSRSIGNGPCRRPTARERTASADAVRFGGASVRTPIRWSASMTVVSRSMKFVVGRSGWPSRSGPGCASGPPSRRSSLPAAIGPIVGIIDGDLDPEPVVEQLPAMRDRDPARCRPVIRARIIAESRSCTISSTAFSGLPSASLRDQRLAAGPVPVDVCVIAVVRSVGKICVRSSGMIVDPGRASSIFQ